MESLFIHRFHHFLWFDVLAWFRVVLSVSVELCVWSSQAKLMGALLVCLDAAVSFHILH